MLYVRQGKLFDINVAHVFDDIVVAGEKMGTVQYPVGWFHNQENRVIAGIQECDEAEPQFDALTEKALPADPAMVGGRWTQQFQIVKLTTEEAAIALAAAKADLMQRANVLKAQALYKDVTIPFPVDQKTIQFRNEADRANLESKVMSAIGCIAVGQSDDVMSYICADNSVATLTVAQMVKAGQAVLAIKESVIYAFRNLKDSIEAADTVDALLAVQINVEQAGQ